MLVFIWRFEYHSASFQALSPMPEHPHFQSLCWMEKKACSLLTVASYLLQPPTRPQGPPDWKVCKGSWVQR